MHSQMCEPQNIYNETPVLLRSNIFTFWHIILETHIVWFIKSQTRVFKIVKIEDQILNLFRIL